MTQEAQVITALRAQGGYATLRRLNEVLDFNGWRTKTPEASVRRIVQNSGHIFKIKPGLWALTEVKERVLENLNLQPDNPKSVEQFSHAYYQGLLVEIGKLQGCTTFVPAQDKHRRFLEKELGEVSNMTVLPSFTYEHLLRKARTVDVIWFNARQMPTHFYEVEHTTDIKSSLLKFYELQDFFSSFFIVADKHRENEFFDKLGYSIYSPIKDRVRFLSYEKVASLHSNLFTRLSCGW